MADLMIRTGIDARGFKRGLYAMEKDLGDAGRRMSGRFGGERGFDPFRLDKGAGKAGAMALGFNPRTGLVGGLILGLKGAYDAVEKYEERLPEVYRKTADIGKATGGVVNSWARATREILPELGDGLEKVINRVTSRLGSLGAMLFAGGTAGPGQIDDFLADTERKMIREGGRAGRESYFDRLDAERLRKGGNEVGAIDMEADAAKRDALLRLEEDAAKLAMNPEEKGRARAWILEADQIDRAAKKADLYLQVHKEIAGELREGSELARKRREEDEKAAEAAAKEAAARRTSREDAAVDIYEARARFRDAKATTDEEKKSAEEARAYAKYKREELAIKRMGLEADQEGELSIYNQAEYEATIEGIRNRRGEPRGKHASPDGLDLSSAGAVASQGQAFAFSIPGKIDRTNALLQQANQTLREIKQGQGDGARFAP